MLLAATLSGHANICRIVFKKMAAILVQSEGNPWAGTFIAKNYPLSLATIFCPKLKIRNDDLIILEDPAEYDFEYDFESISRWMEDCSNAKAELPFPDLDDKSFFHYFRIAAAAKALRLYFLVHELEQRMHDIESGQVSNEDIKLVYALDPPEKELRLRVASSIARADCNNSLQDALSIYELREKIPDFDDDVVNVMEHIMLAKPKDGAQHSDIANRSDKPEATNDTCS